MRNNNIPKTAPYKKSGDCEKGHYFIFRNFGGKKISRFRDFFCQIIKFNSRKYQDFLQTVKFLKFFSQPRNLFPQNSTFESLEISIQCLIFVTYKTIWRILSQIMRGRPNSWIKGLVFIGDCRNAMARKCRRENDKNSKQKHKKVHTLANI